MNPMLATAVSTLPAGGGWSYEFKWDGVRALLDVTDRATRLFSRAANDISGGYPELLAQAAGVGDALFDGEIVAFDDGRPSFGALQTRMHLRDPKDVLRAAAATPVTFVVFDLVRRFGVDLTARSYRERRATLERFAAEHEGWTLSPTFDDGAATEQVARDNGLEGVIAKRLTSAYRPGARSDDWRKLRFTRSGDFVVIGWESAAHRPDVLSSLVLGMSSRSGGPMMIAGRVGSGIAGRTATRIRGLLVDRAGPAVADVTAPMPGRRLRWVEPTVVVEVEFAAWTDDGRLRQPVFRGIRSDKRIEEATGDG